MTDGARILGSATTKRDVAAMLGVSLKTLTWMLHVRGTSSYYKHWSVKKRLGGTRTISAPRSTLWRVQSALHGILQDAYKPRPATHGFVKDRSVSSNAKDHVGKSFVLTIDLEDFFPSIHIGRVRGLFMAHPFNCTMEVATTLAQICTVNRQLPIGAPTSPVISNMICVRMDREFQRLARDNGCWYTRYADDLTFSTRKTVFPTALAKLTMRGKLVLGGEVIRVLQENGFSPNPSKSRLKSSHDRQVVTGVKVNVRPNVDRRYVRRIRGMLHAWSKYGLPAAQDYMQRCYTKDRHPGADPQFKDVLRGRIAYLAMIRGEEDAMVRRFRDQYDNLVANRGLHDGIDYHPEIHYPNVSEGRHRLLTVMFTDIVNSSDLNRTLGDDKWGVILERHDRLVGAEVRRRRGRVVKGTGDGVFATFDSPSMALQTAEKIVGKVRALGIEARIGIHAGEVEVSRGDVHGDVVNTAARIADKARGSEVLVSETVRDLVSGGDYRFNSRKKKKLKGVGRWRLHALVVD